ncbi:cysteine--tRNA ligase [Leptospira inadai serovar Lyme str. 10]|uniref:Cysteine--tRNA ligase n=2 Tax=Leptospira inadai serovar Lyme TaxID=293084 RepID=V6HE84_9LEPT|nr:cysteine--tRNA ligase [Leptospira inadai]EQA37583.1 cysteine--tRNA ligase [Leptospira inadai serovar Lyme str. 10]PNV72802.1 cysteine--tRNA ligase [Leptospira inadai serovar Lyme]
MREVRFYNSLTGNKVRFSPDDTNRVKIYSCGPTVYNFAHIGNLRAFLFVDLLRRSLKALGFIPDMTMNITDIDDKIIRESIQKKESILDFTRPWTEAFFEDLETIGIEKLEHYPKATDSVPEMVEIVHRLKERGLVYEKEGSLYYPISKFGSYGKLSHIDVTGMKTGTRYDTDEYEKDDVRDFVLWKSPKVEGETSWETDIGTGRPGWHLECSAMIRKIYGSGIDIHTGGVDLTFPHHENEIAQSEGAYPNEVFVKYWLHSEHLLVNGEKMSKSRGNFYTLRDLISKGAEPKAIRFLLLTTHYRSKLNFTFERLEEARQSVLRLQACVNRLLEAKQISQVEKSDEPPLPDPKLWEDMLDALADDLNISKFLASTYEAVRTVNQRMDQLGWGKSEIEDAIRFFERVDRILGVLSFDLKRESLDSEIDELVKQRLEARKNKDFALSDKIRDQLNDMGIVIEDTKEGLRWRRK